jgi:hypothetical protein
MDDGVKIFCSIYALPGKNKSAYYINAQLFIRLLVPVVPNPAKEDAHAPLF